MRTLTASLFLAFASAAGATGLNRVRFIVVDPATGKPTAGFVSVVNGSGKETVLPTQFLHPGETSSIEGVSLDPTLGNATTIVIPIGTSVVLKQDEKIPTKEITIRVTASRIVPNQAPAGAQTTVRDKDDIQRFTGPGQQDAKALTKGQAGVAEDSGGQAHVRGEHGDISYVVDGVPLPDTLSGRQGAVVVSSTIERIEIITGGFAPEFGGQTAAILNVTTLGKLATPKVDYNLSGGSYHSWAGDLTAVGPLGSKASYVIDLNGSQTQNYQEPPQPDHQDAHNEGSSQSAFARFRLAPNSKDAFSLTLSGNPANIQLPNRTGLPSSFESVGQGFGIFGLRNADGTRPGAEPGTLGSETIVLPSQEDAGQDIKEKDATEFVTLSYNRKLGSTATGQLALTLLHSGQDVTNNNPSVDLFNLPVDSSIEYNPTVSRNVHHVQLTGNVGDSVGAHKLKAGFLFDDQSGVESYHLVPGSQLALNALAATAPDLAPPGFSSDELDVNGNAIYTATGAVPTLRIERQGYYGAAYGQDSWSLGRLTANFGLRGDWYGQSLNGGVAKIDVFELNPRLNFTYEVGKNTQAYFSYNRLLNTPPIAQGAVLGAVIQPEIVDQYDASVTHAIGHGQKISAAYYYKQIKNQFDTALLIPGSQIGIYRTVSLERGGVHGIELSYEIASQGGVGWDGFLNYSMSAAKPNGLENGEEPVEDFADHDQTHTVGLGLAYSWKSGMSVAMMFQYGSGLASSVLPPSEKRTPRSSMDLKFFSGNVLFGDNAGLTLDIQNVFDSREVINFQSDFSGTRFQQGRRITLGLSGHF